MGIFEIALIIIIILVSMTLHEVMHGFVANMLGDPTAADQGRLTLNPLKHIDPFLTILLPVLLAVAGLPIFGGAKPVPFNPNRVRHGEWGVALVSIAGPLTNLLIAFITFGVGAVSGIITEQGIINSTFGLVIALTISVNLGFFAFNILPIPPLDGSRVLYAFAPDFLRKALMTIERYGIIFVFAIVLLGGTLLGGIMNGITSGLYAFFEMIFQI